MAVRKVRTRRTRTPVVPKVPTKAQEKAALTELAKLRNLMIEADLKAKQVAEEKEALQALMVKYGIHDIALEDIEAEMAVPTRRKTRAISPLKFWEAVEDEADFFACCSISVTEAQKVLSGKELDEISTFHTAKAKPPELRVKMVKPKKGK